MIPKLTLDGKRETEKIKSFLEKEVRERGFTKVMIACSGGIDSTVVAYLCVKALGKTNVCPLLLPFGNLSNEETIDAQLALGFLSIPQEHIVTIDIKRMVESFTTSLRIGDKKIDNVRMGNIMARARMICLYDQAKKRKALVVGTENKSEHLLGYYTRFGDEASDIEVIRHLYKTQVIQLAAYLGVPKKIIIKPPTANLWLGQTDEGQFGFSYAQADPILWGLYDKKMSMEELVRHGIKKELIEKVKLWIKANSFKREVPIVFSPSKDR